MKKFRKILIKYRFVITTVFFAIVLINIFVTPEGSDLYYLSLIPLFIAFSFITNLKSKYSFLFCLLLLLILFVKYILNGPKPQTENTAVWFVLFFTSGIIKKWKE